MKNIGNARFEGALVFFAEQAVFAKQREGLFDAPSFRQNDESAHIVGAFDHFDIQARFDFAFLNDFAIVYPVSPHLLECWIFAMSLVQNGDCTVTILYGRWRYHNDEHETQHVYQQVAFSPIDFFPRVVAFGPADIGCFDALAVDDRCGWLCISPSSNAHHAAETIVNLLEHSLACPALVPLKRQTPTEENRAATAARNNLSACDDESRS